MLSSVEQLDVHIRIVTSGQNIYLRFFQQSVSFNLDLLLHVGQTML